MKQKELLTELIRLLLMILKAIGFIGCFVGIVIFIWYGIIGLKICFSFLILYIATDIMFENSDKKIK